MAFKKLSYYLYDAKVAIKSYQAPLHRLLTVQTLNSKVNKLGTEIVSMSHVTFEHIKGTDKILADSISYIRLKYLFGSLGHKGKGKEFGHKVFEEFPPKETNVNKKLNPPLRRAKKPSLK